MVSYLALLQTNLHGHQQKNLAPESSDGFAVYIFSPTAPSLSLKGDGLLPALEMQRIHRREGRAGEGYEGDEDSVSKGVWCGGLCCLEEFRRSGYALCCPVHTCGFRSQGMSRRRIFEFGWMEISQRLNLNMFRFLCSKIWLL